MTVVTAHLSTTAEGYDLARARQSMDPIFPLGGAFAEGDKNDARTVYLSDPAQPSYHAWYYDGPNDHRFDSVEVQGATLTGRRPDRDPHHARSGRVQEVRSSGARALPRDAHGTPSGVEYRRQGIKLTFVGAPAAPAARPAPPRRRRARRRRRLRAASGPVCRHHAGEECPAGLSADRVERPHSGRRGHGDCRRHRRLSCRREDRAVDPASRPSGARSGQAMEVRTADRGRCADTHRHDDDDHVFIEIRLLPDERPRVASVWFRINSRTPIGVFPFVRFSTSRRGT